MELKCPKCNTLFKVDESDYAALISQVRNAEFEKEMKRRVADMELRRDAEEESRASKARETAAREKANHEKSIAELQAQIERLRGEIKNSDAIREAELAAAAVRAAKELSEVAGGKDKEISRLRLDLQLKEKQNEIDVAQARAEWQEKISDREKKITELDLQLNSAKITAEKRAMELKEHYEVILRAKDDEIERQRDMKIRLSTKMLGETLEQHCANVFDDYCNLGLFPNATFEKDNDIKPGGTKGDFIFRDYLDGREYISIMFEMKNEADATAVKHKNSHFYEKLNKDRCEKNCQYAVLVSMLEQDNDKFNNGIFCVTQYDRMYVIRPQMFIQLISLLSQNARHSAKEIGRLKGELALAQAQSVDVTNFEARRNRFGEEFSKWVGNAVKKHEKAMADIDKAIENLEKQITLLRGIRQSFDDSDRQLLKANEKFETDFTIKKLVRGNPTMKAKFEEVRRQQALESGSNEGDENLTE